MTTKPRNKFLPEVRARAVLMVFDHETEYPSRWAAMISIATKIGFTPQSLNDWVKAVGLQGVIRGKPVKTTVQDKAAPCPLDHVNWLFKAPAPNILWVSDFTNVSTCLALYMWRSSLMSLPGTS